MDITTVAAIDVHAHYGPMIRGQQPLIDDWLSIDAPGVVDLAKKANTRLTVASPMAGLVPRGHAVTVPANEEAARLAREIDGLLQWVIVHPEQPETYDQASEMLQQPQCMGIKIHPEEHQYEITKHGGKLFDFAAEHDAVVLAHTGDPFSWPADFLPFINEHENVRLILAHLGNGGSAAGDPTLQVRAIQAARYDNVYVDTSSSRSILNGLLEWAVGEIGRDRILYGTDSPLYSAAMQRARVDQADISDDAKHCILYRNAENLLGLADVES